MARASSQTNARALSPGWTTALLLCGVVLLSQAFRLPSPVRDAATLQWVPGYQVSFPVWHLVFTPFCSLADYLTLLSVNQHKVLFAWVVLLAFGVKGLRKGLLIVGAYLAFAAWAALVPRPMDRLVAADPNVLLIDFHSHTRLSHDGRKSFSPEANMHWHQAQGYGAAFITDHNQVGSAEQATALSERDWRSSGFRSLRGEEVSLAKTHLVVLGNHSRIDNRPYDSDPRRIGPFIAAMHSSGLTVIASLPEYWLYHWGPGIDAFLKEGIDGFELVNSAPKAQDFPIADRLQIAGLCRRQNLIVTGISDTHGYGYATAVWNAMRIPGWEGMSPGALEMAVLYQLEKERFRAVTVLERYRFIARNPVTLLLSPIGHLIAYWRGLSAAQAIAWSFWILAATFIRERRRFREVR